RNPIPGVPFKLVSSAQIGSRIKSQLSWKRRPLELERSIFGPAKIDKGVIEAGEGKTYDVEVAAFDAGNEAARVALNGIGAGLVVRFAGGKVAEDLFAR